VVPDQRPMVIAIDGPAGAGKSTVARALAARLGFTYMDSGAMYRCVALAALEQGIDVIAPDVPPGELGRVARSVRIELGDTVTLDGRDVTAEIRTPAVSEAASRVAAEPEVRAAMVKRQRELMREGDWVAEGRDIGTVVAPRAQLKVFLTATPHERARRRAGELDADARTVLAEQALRDARDESRTHSPLTAAPDAVTLDTTALAAQEVVERIAELAAERRREAS
jgi:cytidylate kinase